MPRSTAGLHLTCARRVWGCDSCNCTASHLRNIINKNKQILHLGALDQALVPFDDYCVAATTAIAKIEEVLEQVGSGIGVKETKLNTRKPHST